MYHSDNEIFSYLEKKFREITSKKNFGPGFKLFLSEKELFNDLEAETPEEKSGCLLAQQLMDLIMHQM